MERRGEISSSVVNEFDQASKGLKLPQRASMSALKHHSRRGHGKHK